ncbi:alpha/beta-hydrolase [Trichodelitschia bisporula]|uniref:Alpha/beta-hydrolase n=1 Tax=Trichodelitschia bisporula TaxID=703511 RepID=A0A6G1I4Z6_9PEZI|nr:alpha/beta-hydrolase [Trichodelitschia bisporula]
MVLNTISVGAAVTPTVIETSVSHYLNRKPLRQKPTAHISYHVGLNLVRKFILESAYHTVEELQAFTSQWVPAPHWVYTKDVDIPERHILKGAECLQAELGSHGIKQVGGRQWWQWRRENTPLKAEWIEMRKDYQERKANGEQGTRIMMYIHGGAYYFGSVDEHRYQIQRHARKLKARCLAPRYRLAPQFPFPCGLHDCLATYLHLIEEHDPSSIIVAGDSAGGGMALSLLIVLRNQGIPLPAGAILISPWVDLMHSFPSIAGDGRLDYIPSHGFIHKPSVAWPPPTMEDKKSDSMPSGLAAAAAESRADADLNAERGFSISYPADVDDDDSPHIPSLELDGKIVQIRDQIQIYAPNHLLSHPLVSPVLQPSLGGLPPLLIQVGGGEMLRDEQIYIAHKAANPTAYPPSNETLDKYDPHRQVISKYPPTDVQLQVWEDLCHVGHTLSWTRPAKYMYRSVAQFGAWALARAQNRPIDIPEDDFSDSDTESAEDSDPEPKSGSGQSEKAVGVAGDPLPPFGRHMIRQRVDRHGKIHPLAPAAELPALQLQPEEIGTLKEIPVRKWLARQAQWNKRFASTKTRLQAKLALQVKDGYVGLLPGERPPPSALAGRRTKDMPRLAKIKRSWGLSLWSGWGSNFDKMAQRDEPPKPGRSRSRSRARSASRPKHPGHLRTVSDMGQAPKVDEAGVSRLTPASAAQSRPDTTTPLPPALIGGQGTVIPESQNGTTRPTYDGIAYPFKLKADNGWDQNSSMVTLDGAEKSEV